MFSAFSKAIAQLGDRKMRQPLWIGIGAALVLFFLLWSGIATLLTETTFFTIGWLETVIDILGGLATLVLTWFLFPAVISLVIGFLLERVADAVEERHYPHLPKAEGLPLLETILATGKFLCVLVLLNVFALLFLLVPPLFPFVFYGVNGYLLGREYFELVALRRMGAKDARALRKSHNVAVVMTGVGLALLLTIPIVNLVTPIVATAVMVHLFESWRQRMTETSVAKV